MEHRNRKNLLGMMVLLGGMMPAAASASVAHLLITENMANPTAVSDTYGEWIELYNPTLQSVDLDGILLSDDGSNSHVISAGGSLLINPGDYFVMARSDDPLNNGGFNADYVYSNFSLGNTSDQIVFSDGSGELLRLDYGSGFVVAGQSTELLGLPMTAAQYGLTDGTHVYGLGDIGTPGAAGAYTPAPVPLPAAVWLFSSGLAGLVGISRRRRLQR
jgi:hypothetical protein